MKNIIFVPIKDYFISRKIPYSNTNRFDCIIIIYVFQYR